ncbi:MAG: Cof-type HAD-IIB family hydrolase [Treponema sp.]|jgi:Cof subfamily protein (haloacid dehalogenase superfamily)|nr:Cof-type HAD-IIB family hydrolase [Treponema sp.]
MNGTPADHGGTSPRILNPKTVKAVALDLDGTALLPGNTLSPKTVKVLKTCMEKGVAVIIATGRAVDAAEKYRLAIGAEGPMVYFNGAEVVDMPSRRLLSAALLDRETAVFCAELSRSMGVHFQVFLSGRGKKAGTGSDGEFSPVLDAEILLIEKESPEAEMYRGHTGLLPVVGDIAKALSAPGSGCVKGMFIADPALHGAISRKISGRFGNGAAVVRTYPTFLEVLNPGVSKGEGLKTALLCRGVNPEDTVALGDEENDLSMFAAAGFSAAPANAREQVRKAADRVIGANSEDGAAAFLEELLSQRSGP